MKVRVYPPVYATKNPLDPEGYLELPEPATLRDVHKALGVKFPYRQLGLCFINYRFATSSVRLSDGDTVSYLAFVSGG